MSSQEIDADAKIVWDYLQMGHELIKSDAIFVLRSFDTRVADRAAELYRLGYGKYVVVSGGSSGLTKVMFTEPEARVFAKIIMAAGVPADKVIIEDASTNTGENIEFTYRLLQEKGLKFSSMKLVQKPYMYASAIPMTSGR